ncbi:hypothetical protein HNP86_001349 [Methanococcus maripaludis]|uniref:Uncharacterized protein n=1 Tax=Methanococcus maripaludis TaxID=39152 RepID=A0A7J9NU66_METMI|nr:hypothetical protein [Methanococcus maripaludis]MBA2851218.1 hypothetical protein [Methanococcus maripaludis]
MSLFNFKRKYDETIVKSLTPRLTFGLEINPKNIGLTDRDTRCLIVLKLYERYRKKLESEFNGDWGSIYLNKISGSTNAEKLIKYGYLTSDEKYSYYKLTTKGIIFAKLLNIWVFFIDKLDEFLVFLALLCLDRIISQFIQNWTFKIYILGFLVLIALRYFKNK